MGLCWGWSVFLSRGWVKKVKNIFLVDLGVFCFVLGVF